MTDGLNLEELNRLSEEEKEIALKILNQYSANGSSDLFSKLIYDDYAEIPVDIETFIDDDNYLGNEKNEGKSKLYPYWRKN